MTPEIFHIRATRCIRCGGILLSEYGLKHGMGHVCKRKYDAEHAPIDERQLTLFEEPKKTELGYLELSVRGFNSLKRKGYNYISDLAGLNEDELREAVGGRKSDYETLVQAMEKG